MIRKYLEIAKKSFQTNLVYRFEYFAGVVNTVLMMFVSSAIWKAIFEEEEALSGLQFKMVMTYIVLGILIQSIFLMDEFLIENKVRSGMIATDLLKPIGFKLYVFSHNVGILLFRILLQFLPALLFAIFFFKLLPPFSIKMAVYSLLSLGFAYLVLYNLSFIVWITSFWFNRIFSLVTIKDAAVLIFSGALLPLWFMPQSLADFIRLTPFSSIYFIPLSIYLGQIPLNEIIFNFGIQIIWILILYLIGQLLWSRAIKKLVIQGG